MFNKDNWLAPINKKELKNVILFGFLTSILLGIISGLFNFLVSLSGMQLDLGLIILSFGISTMVNRQYTSFHIIYAVLTIPMMIVGLFFGMFGLCLCIDPSIHVFKYLISGGFYLSFIRAPFYGIISGIKTGHAAVAVVGALNLVVYIFGFYYCYHCVERNAR